MSAPFYLVPVVAAVLAAADEAPTKWSEHKSDTGRYTVRMPGTVKTGSMPLPIPGANVTMYYALVESKDHAYMVAYADLPGGGPFDYDAAVKAMAKTWGGTVNYQKKVKVGGLDGVEFEAKVTKPATGHATGRLFLHKGRLYEVLALGTKIRASSKDVKMFWDSFKVTDEKK